MGGVGSGRVLTAEGSNRGIDGLHEDAFTMELWCDVSEASELELRGRHTSSQLLASSKIHPSSMTSAESLVT